MHSITIDWQDARIDVDYEVHTDSDPETGEAWTDVELLAVTLDGTDVTGLLNDRHAEIERRVSAALAKRPGYVSRPVQNAGAFL